MSEYTNYISDFPNRCGQLLAEFELPARRRRREVTFMLCVATPAIVVPLERLKKPTPGPHGKRPGHPSGDWHRFNEASSMLEGLSKSYFIGSQLWPQPSAGSWRFGSLADVSGGPDNWEELRQPKALGPRKQAGTVLRHVRNALAHGNIFTRGRGDIEQIILLCQRDIEVFEFEFLAVAPADFAHFLRNWLSFLATLRLPLDVVGMSVGDAA